MGRYFSPEKKAAMIQKAREMEAAGVWRIDIAAHLGVSTQFLIRHLGSTGTSKNYHMKRPRIDAEGNVIDGEEMVALPGPGKPYPREIREKAVELMRGGKTAAAVSRELGVAYLTVYGWKRGVGLTKKTTPIKSNGSPDKRFQRNVDGLSKAKKLFDAGVTFREASKRLGLPKSTVYGWYREFRGLPRKSNLEKRMEHKNKTPLALHNRITSIPIDEFFEKEPQESAAPRKRSNKMIFLAFGPEDTVTLCLQNLAQMMGHEGPLGGDRQ